MSTLIDRTGGRATGMRRHVAHNAAPLAGFCLLVLLLIAGAYASDRFATVGYAVQIGDAP